jgi:hypothetical protein
MGFKTYRMEPDPYADRFRSSDTVPYFPRFQSV